MASPDGLLRRRGLLAMNSRLAGDVGDRRSSMSRAGRIGRRSRIFCSAANATDTAQPRRRAAMLAIGTANPPNSMSQDEYADWYFRVTNSDHLTNLKHKLKKICKHKTPKISPSKSPKRSKSGIRKRHFYHGDDTFRDHPELAVRGAPSLDARQDILRTAVPELAAAAAARAIDEWGRPASDVTHLVFANLSGVSVPGHDLRLASLLGLRPSVQRTSMYFHGCSAAAAALRVAKDIAENNPGTARVLVACAELSLFMFRAPTPTTQRDSTLVVQALFADGAGAVIVGAGDDTDGERKVFDIMSAVQTVLPDSEGGADGQLYASGLVFQPSFKLPAMLRDRVEQCLAKGIGPLAVAAAGGGGGWNDMFWAVHPGGRAILDGVEEGLSLAPEKLEASRRVLSEYGNMSGAGLIFVLDELRRGGDLPPGGLGVMIGVGPGVSIETMLLRAPAA
uniref:Chalcone/stilbene synthase N-terminal domain-containing protein n=1 Tax=Leersia perrieri TaxID=77586 RepID=A0A0D9XSM5_9ORYZ